MTNQSLHRALLLGVLVLTCLAQGGCLLLAAGGLAAGLSDADRKAYHANNLEREKAGLPPLTREEWKKQKPAKENVAGLTDEDRKAFQANNLEREKSGLPPLTADEWKNQKPAGSK